MNKKLRTVIIILFLVVCALWGFLSPKKIAKQSETTKVRITTMPVVQGLPLFLALDKGYFKDAGLEVEFVKFESPNQIIDALMQGKVDFTPPSAATGVIGIADLKNPDKMKIYSLGGGNLIIQNDAILIKKDSPLTSIKDLKGKKIGIVAGSAQWRIFANEILAQNSLIADQDVTLVELALGVQAQALATSQVDAVLTVEPVPTVVKAKDIGKELIDHAAAKFIANPFYSGAGVIRSAFAAQNPETTRKVLTVFNKAIEEINQNPDLARQYLKGYTSLDDGTIELVPISSFKMYSDFTQEDYDAMQKFYNLFYTYKAVDQKIDFQKLLYSDS